MTHQEHATRRAILMHLLPKMSGHYGPDIKDAYNRQLRARRTRRQLAWLAVLLAAVLVAVSFCLLIDTVCSPLFSAVAANVLIAGIWGGCHLLTHH